MSSQAGPLAMFQKSGRTVCDYVRGPRDVTSCQVKVAGCGKPKEPAQSMHNERVSSSPPVEHPNCGLVVTEDVKHFPRQYGAQRVAAITMANSSL